MTTLSDFSAAAIDGTDTDLSQYDGKVVLVVNTASQCGFTGQYKGLQQLQDTYADQGLVVLGFPCDQFGNQEPGNEAEISDFCERSHWYSGWAPSPFTSTLLNIGKVTPKFLSQNAPISSSLPGSWWLNWSHGKPRTAKPSAP